MEQGVFCAEEGMIMMQIVAFPSLPTGETVSCQVTWRSRSVTLKTLKKHDSKLLPTSVGSVKRWAWESQNEMPLKQNPSSFAFLKLLCFPVFLFRSLSQNPFMHSFKWKQPLNLSSFQRKTLDNFPFVFLQSFQCHWTRPSCDLTRHRFSGWQTWKHHNLHHYHSLHRTENSLLHLTCITSGLFVFVFYRCLPPRQWRFHCLMAGECDE